MIQKCLKMNSLTIPNLAVKNRTHLILVHSILVYNAMLKTKRTTNKYYTVVSKFPTGGTD